MSEDDEDRTPEEQERLDRMRGSRGEEYAELILAQARLVGEL